MSQMGGSTSKYSQLIEHAREATLHFQETKGHLWSGGLWVINRHYTSSGPRWRRTTEQKGRYVVLSGVGTGGAREEFST